jgi:hypothetical protein
MAMEEDLQIDPFLQLLTDALRAGPGSPEWHEAVQRVSAGETGPDNEYAILVQARENLASGKSYREVRAGVGFTRKVLADIDKDVAASVNRKSPISASWISYLGAGLMVATVAVIISFLVRDGGPAPTEDLSSMVFGSTLASVTFDGPLPSSWRLIGPLPVDPAKGLAPTLARSSPEYVGGGIVSTRGISPTEPFAVEASFQFQHVSDQVVPQLFVTDDPNFSSDKATSPHELVWMVKGGLAQIWLPDGQLTTGGKKINDGDLVSVRIVVGQRDTAVMCNGRILWSGPSQLADNKPRYVGVRLLCRKDEKRSMVTVKELRELVKSTGPGLDH